MKVQTVKRSTGETVKHSWMTSQEAKKLVKKPGVLFGVHKFKKATPKVQKMLNEVERIGY